MQVDHIVEIIITVVLFIAASLVQIYLTCTEEYKLGDRI